MRCSVILFRFVVFFLVFFSFAAGVRWCVAAECTEDDFLKINAEIEERRDQLDAKISSCEWMLNLLEPLVRGHKDRDRYRAERKLCTFKQDNLRSWVNQSISYHNWLIDFCRKQGVASGSLPNYKRFR